MPRWLKLKAAAEYSSIGKHRLKDPAAKGVIRGYPDPDSARGDGDMAIQKPIQRPMSRKKLTRSLLCYARPPDR